MNKNNKNKNKSNKELELQLGQVNSNINQLRSAINKSTDMNLEIFSSIHQLSKLSTLAQQLHTFRSTGISTFIVNIQNGKREKSRKDITQKGLAVRIEVFAFNKYLEPFYLIMSKVKNDLNVIQINHHTLPSFIDLHSLGKRYLGWTNDSNYNKKTVPSSLNTWVGSHQIGRPF